MIIIGFVVTVMIFSSFAIVFNVNDNTNNAIHSTNTVNNFAQYTDYLTNNTFTDETFTPSATNYYFIWNNTVYYANGDNLVNEKTTNIIATAYSGSATNIAGAFFYESNQFVFYFTSTSAGCILNLSNNEKISVTTYQSDYKDFGLQISNIGNNILISVAFGVSYSSHEIFLMYYNFNTGASVNVEPGCFYAHSSEFINSFLLFTDTSDSYFYDYKTSTLLTIPDSFVAGIILCYANANAIDYKTDSYNLYIDLSGQNFTLTSSSLPNPSYQNSISNNICLISSITYLDYNSNQYELGSGFSAYLSDISSYYPSISVINIVNNKIEFLTYISGVLYEYYYNLLTYHLSIRSFNSLGNLINNYFYYNGIIYNSLVNNFSNPVMPLQILPLNYSNYIWNKSSIEVTTSDFTGSGNNLYYNLSIYYSQESTKLPKNPIAFGSYTELLTYLFIFFAVISLVFMTKKYGFDNNSKRGKK